MTTILVKKVTYEGDNSSLKLLIEGVNVKLELVLLPIHVAVIAQGANAVLREFRDNPEVMAILEEEA